MLKLLIIDDEEDIRTILTYNLSKLNIEIETATDGLMGLEKIRSFKPDIIILDIMMSGKDGIDLCRDIRSNKLDSFVLMLSASGDDYTKIKAYEAGCDDFANKPINIQLLTKKIDAIKNRLENKRPTNKIFSPQAETSNEIKINNDISIDLDSYLVDVKGEKHELPKKQFALLVMLAKNPNKVLTREKIYEQIWGDTIVSERTIDVHITRIRNKLKIDCIKSVKGVGYKINL